MNYIGLVTLWKKNYGSVLQCYAMKQVLNSYGYKSTVLYQEESGLNKYINKVRTLISLIGNSIVYRGFAKSYLAMRKSKNLSIDSLGKKSEQELDFFVKTKIQPKGYSYKELKILGNDDKYPFFVVGSDQIWNGGIIYNPISFLQFVPKCKKIAYAPSFGTNSISKYNIKKYRKAILTFNHLSVREFEGQKIIEELCGRKVPRLADPTVLLDVDEWKEFSKKGISLSDFILCHFLDRPNEIAIKNLQKVCHNTNKKVISFGYPHKELSELGIEYFDGSPEDYVRLIMDADAIFTDSYHTTLFSMRFEKQFYVFDRNYTHKNKQSSRIKTLLKNINYNDRWIDSDKELPTYLHNNKEFFLREKKHALEYLNNIIPKQENKNGLKDNELCVGCGVCELVCPKEAIKMEANVEGYFIPMINTQKCVNCSLCENICQKKVDNEEEHSSFIAYSTEEDIYLKSASGGVFGSIAKSIIENGGIVFGASLQPASNIPVEHICIDKVEDLPKILKSKYVQSDCRKVYHEVKEALNEKRTVLFCGTSCQIAALYKYLNQKYDSLFTIDLICHGVPGTKFFKDYLKYQERKHESNIKNFEFREKCDEIQYTEKIEFENGDFSKIFWKNSLYYRQFLYCESYRESCYNCEYASINKPADITIGDYFEAKQDFPELFCENAELELINYISCIIAHGERGKALLDTYGKYLKTIQVSNRIVQNSHNQLCHPTKYSSFRKKLFNIYKEKGYDGLQKYYDKREKLFFLPKLLYKLYLSMMSYFRFE